MKTSPTKSPKSLRPSSSDLRKFFAWVSLLTRFKWTINRCLETWCWACLDIPSAHKFLSINQPLQLSKHQLPRVAPQELGERQTIAYQDYYGQARAPVLSALDLILSKPTDSCWRGQLKRLARTIGFGTWDERKKKDVMHNMRPRTLGPTVSCGGNWLGADTFLFFLSHYSLLGLSFLCVSNDYTSIN